MRSCDIVTPKSKSHNEHSQEESDSGDCSQQCESTLDELTVLAGDSPSSGGFRRAGRFFHFRESTFNVQDFSRELDKYFFFQVYKTLLYFMKVGRVVIVRLTEAAA